VSAAPLDGIIVFAREPRAGRVKTRLAAAIGAQDAAHAYARLLSRMLRLVERSRFTRRFLYCAEADELPYFSERLDARSWTIRVQSGHDLGARMSAAFQDVLGGQTLAVLVGTDVVDCTLADLDTAREALYSGSATGVLGPSIDGGYWLLGLRAIAPGYFTDMPWSTSAVARLTRAAMRANGLVVLELPPRRDLDDAADLRYQNDSIGGEFES
jgi:rSAM/selenodomain-associated transferase 1